MSKMIKSMRYEHNPIKCIKECNKIVDCATIFLPLNSGNLCQLYQTDILFKVNKSQDVINFFSKKFSPNLEY